MNPTLAILAIGACVAASCALLGSFLVLRRMSLIGDAISHAVLPGIAIAFLATQSRAPLPMVVGAAALGVVTVALVEAFKRTGRLREEASIGVVFPALFSVGVILISRYASSVDLDLDCVLYGEIAYAPWDLAFVGGRSIGPRALWINGTILVANIVFVALFYKELKLATFDDGLAASLGFSPVLIHYLLMTMVSITVVGAFESVGAILVVAMLIVPAATAYLLTERLGPMLALAVVMGVVASTAGYAVARQLDCSIAGAMATVAGLLFLAAFVLSPGQGMLAHAIAQGRVRRMLDEQIVLVHIRDAPDARSPDGIARRLGWSPARVDRILRTSRRAGRLAGDPSRLRLTPDGERLLETR